MNKLLTPTLPTAKVTTYREKKRFKSRRRRRSATNGKHTVKLLKLRKWTPSDGRKSVLSSTRLSCQKRRHYICIDTAGGRGLYRAESLMSWPIGCCRNNGPISALSAYSLPRAYILRSINLKKKQSWQGIPDTIIVQKLYYVKLLQTKLYIFTLFIAC